MNRNTKQCTYTSMYHYHMIIWFNTISWPYDNMVKSQILYHDHIRTWLNSIHIDHLRSWLNSIYVLYHDHMINWLNTI